jgi:signal peptidase
MSIEENCRISIELESLSYPKAFGRSNKETLFFIHTNYSMNPTLWEKDLLEVVPYRQKEDIRIGDVIVFESPVDGTILAHRIIAIHEEGICTKGDNNRLRDPWLLSPEAIFGKVVAVSRNKEHHEVLGGRAGLLKARCPIKIRK